ncbi:diguanylate cyclase [Vibrio sp. T187]|nr:diguanylate cyclase [Vibrio sp. T187]
MNKNNNLRSILLLLLGSTLLFFYIFRPLHLTDAEPTELPKLEVFDPEIQLTKTAYGTQLLRILNESRSDPSQAEHSLSLLHGKQPLAVKPIYSAYRLMILSNIAQHSQLGDEVIRYSEQIKRLAEEENLLWLQASSTVELAIQYAKRGELKKSEQEVLKGIAIAESIRYEQLLVKAYNTAGVVFNIRSDLVSAQYYFHKGLELGKKYPLHIYNSKITSNMALLYIYLEEWHKALELIEQGKTLYERSNLLENVALGLLYTNEAFVYLKLEDAKKSRAAFEVAKQLGKGNVTERFKVILMKSESEILLLEGKAKQALAVSQACLDFPSIDDYTLEKGHCYKKRALAKLALQEKLTDSESIRDDLYQALALYQSVGSRNWIIAGQRSLANYFEAVGDSLNALKYFKLYYQGNKSLLFDRRQSEVFVLEQSYKTHSIQQDNELLNTEKELADALLEKQKLRTRIVSSLVFAVIVGFFFVVRRSHLVEKENQKLIEQNTTCSLTGLYNRRYLEKCLKQGHQVSPSEYGTTIAILDLDYFKQVNDTHGHDVGDEVLVEVAKRLSSSLQEGDIIGRWGGEEFVCILDGSMCPDEQLESIRQSICDVPIQSRAGRLNISTSIGAHSGIGHHSLFYSYQKSLKKADNALYRAKQLGRNRVVFSADI